MGRRGYFYSLFDNLFALDNTVVADIQPKLIETFGEIEKLPWVAVSYGLGSMSVNLLWYSFSIP